MPHDQACGAYIHTWHLERCTVHKSFEMHQRVGFTRRYPTANETSKELVSQSLHKSAGYSDGDGEICSPYIIRRRFGLHMQIMKVTLRTDGNARAPQLTWLLALWVGLMSRCIQTHTHGTWNACVYVEAAYLERRTQKNGNADKCHKNRPIDFRQKNC